MKKMYWRPRRVSRTALSLISIASVGGYIGVERFSPREQEPYYQEKLAASQLTNDAFKAIRAERLRLGIAINPEADPAQSGMIGALVTPVTTNAGSLIAKQTSVNPNFAAVVVSYLREIGLGEGDLVGIGYSGSFPALNVAVLAAVETLKLRPIIIASASSSQWGANEPNFLWIDMEKLLFDKKIFHHRAIAASVGGIEDKGLGMSKRGQRIIEDRILAQDMRLINPIDFDDSIEQRMRIYRQEAGADPIRAYINVGGGSTSVGRKIGKKMFTPGVNLKTPTASYPIDSVMGRFVREGVPVIHLSYVQKLAQHYAFPTPPLVMPNVGEGHVFYRNRVNFWLVSTLLAGILGALYLFVRSDLGFRMTRTTRRSDKAHPEPMV
ncbi:MAG: poly-gamma-glutamate system protein [Deltaproteobacteria bacterium]|nr:poly-gamma-glutamate system protein [Deltaproteobacteria bacterium]